MDIRVECKKLHIDGEVTESNLHAIESTLIFRENGHAFRFINMKDAAGQVLKVAVVSNGSLATGKFARTALAKKIILDEVQNLLDEEFHLKDRYRTDKNTLKLAGVFDKVAASDTVYVPLKHHVSKMSQLEPALDGALETLKRMMEEIIGSGSFSAGDISELLSVYINEYVFPLEYELQVQGYLLKESYSALQADIRSNKFKLGLLEKKRLKKHVDMMSGLDMKTTPWITILEENLKEPLNMDTSDESMKDALESHLRRQSKSMANSIIYI